MTQLNTDYPQRLAVSRHGMVSSQHTDATKAGVEILEAGGNAIDAAVATAFTLGVCEPAASGLGGQTMMLVHTADPRKTIAVDGSSKVPSRAIMERMPKKAMHLRGHRATTVPSSPAVLSYMLEHYGTMPLHRVLEPAIELAKNGYVISALQHRLQVREEKHWLDGNAGDFLLKGGKTPYDEGELCQQPVLAGTLSVLAEKGIEEFYQGDIAALIEKDMIKNDGFLRRDDLALIPNPIERRPISCRFGPWRVITYPPPGAGRTLVEMMNILNQFEPKAYGLEKRNGLFLLCEVIRRAQLDRADRPYEPNFYPQVQDRRMLTVDYAKLAAKQIRSRVKTRKSGSDTTHLSVMDRHGNVVALTQSIERVYGSFVVTPELGFLYNNYMSAFEYEDITHPYYLRPGAIPWASVAPTILFKGKRPHMAIGSPGSERIATSILQVLIRLMNGQPYLDAVSAPRLHCTVDGKVHLEASRFRDDLCSFLKRRGYKIVEKEPYAFYMGCVQLTARDGKLFFGVADIRRDGAAKGPARASTMIDNTEKKETEST